MATKKKASKKSSKRTRQTAPKTDEKPAGPGTSVAALDQDITLAGDQLPATTDPMVIALRENPEFVKYEIAKRVAHTLANSNMVPEDYRGRTADCFIAVQMGAEIGLGPFQAIQSIAVINGRPCLWGDALIGVCRSSPKCEWIEEEIKDDGKTAICRTLRKGDRNPIERTFTWQDAIDAGLHNKNIWQKHPKRMLQMRARAFCLRDAYPDLLKGISVAEEVQDYHGSPTPIQSYELPGHGTMKANAPMPDQSNGAEQPRVSSNVPPDDPTGAKPQYTLLATVERMIRESKSMEDLLKAAEEAKKLKNENDRKTARHTYNQKRNILMAAEGNQS